LLFFAVSPLFLRCFAALCLAPRRNLAVPRANPLLYKHIVIDDMSIGTREAIVEP